MAADYGHFKTKTNSSLAAKAAHLTTLSDSLHQLREQGPSMQPLKDFLQKQLAETESSIKTELAAIHTALAVSGVPCPASDEPEAEDGEAPAEPVTQPAGNTSTSYAAVGSRDLAKIVPKPAPYSGVDDVDEALFTFESYLDAIGAAKSSWPVVATPLLVGEARKAWMSVAVPLKHQGIDATWETFCSSLRDAFAAPNKQFHARMQLKHVRQMDSTAVQYVRRVRSLIASLGSAPPSQQEQILALYDGLHPTVKAKAAVDPQTGQFWATFDALASYLINLETQVPSSPMHRPAFGPRPTKAKLARMHAARAPQVVAPAKKPAQPAPQQHQQQAKPGGRPRGPNTQGHNRGGKRQKVVTVGVDTLRKLMQESK